jgi:hypothetical protein
MSFWEMKVQKRVERDRRVAQALESVTESTPELVTSAAASSKRQSTKRTTKTRQKSKKKRAVKKIAAAMKSAEPTKTALPEFADDSDVPAYDGITWYSNGDGGCEGRTHGRNGTWVIIRTIDGGRHFAAYHPHGAMNIDDRKEIGTFSMIEEAQAACEKDRVSQKKETAA